jgi:hypothetical protein
MPGAPAVSAVTRIGMFENVHPTEFRVAAETFLSGAMGTLLCSLYIQCYL